jgi:hypothetical protein
VLKVDDEDELSSWGILERDLRSQGFLDPPLVVAGELDAKGVEERNGSIHDAQMLNRKPTNIDLEIHQDLLMEAAGMVTRIPDLWNTQKSIIPAAFVWPNTRIWDDAGRPLDGIVYMEIPKGVPIKEALVRFLIRTKAFALLTVIEEREKIVGSFESPHGSKIWTYRIHDHGDIRYVSQEFEIVLDAPATGLLWRPTTDGARTGTGPRRPGRGPTS